MVKIEKTYNRFLMISGHDYRSQRKANIHFIVRELSQLGTTRLFSAGFSLLSLIKRDPRASLWNKGNREERVNDVDCYLHRKIFHPFNLRNELAFWLEQLWFELYLRTPPRTLKRWIKESDFIIIESGLGIIYFDLIKAINPQARVTYLCSDALSTIGCSDFLKGKLREAALQFDAIIVPSKSLADEFPPQANLYFVPHGIDKDNILLRRSSPYEAGLNLVSVGSMLFDANFFKVAAKAFPDVRFHIIGAGQGAKNLIAPNISVYGEMAFDETIRYIQHADAGIAPYQADKVSPYLADTSMKLMQYELLNIPAICPNEVVGNRKWRFGYNPNDENSIIKAINQALSGGSPATHDLLSWKEVVAQIINPVFTLSDVDTPNI